MGHNADENGQYAIARQWKDNRANIPGGGVASSVADQLRWARFHLGDPRAPDGTRVLPARTLHQDGRPGTARASAWKLAG